VEGEEKVLVKENLYKKIQLRLLTLNVNNNKICKCMNKKCNI